MKVFKRYRYVVRDASGVIARLYRNAPTDYMAKIRGKFLKREYLFECRVDISRMDISIGQYVNFYTL